ncbi:MAG: hypothetical protein U0559_09435 [Anaerolineae bacterium]
MHTFLADEKVPRPLRTRGQSRRHAAPPNIVQVYDFDVENGVYYMVMEFINGETLKARLQALESAR